MSGLFAALHWVKKYLRIENIFEKNECTNLHYSIISLSVASTIFSREKSKTHENGKNGSTRHAEARRRVLDARELLTRVFIRL